MNNPPNKLKLVGMLVLLLCFMDSLRTAPAAERSFQMEGNRCIARSHSLELVIQGGAVTSIRDLRTGEIFSQGESREKLNSIPSGSSSIDDWWTFRASWDAQKPSRYTENKKNQEARQRPGPDSIPEFKQVNRFEAELVYKNLTGGTEGDELRYSVRIEKTTGEILLQAMTRLTDSEKPPVTLDIPLINLKVQAVTLGNGARYVRNDPPVVDFCIRIANNLYSPRLAVIEGKRSCVSVLPDSPYGIDNIFLAHGTGTDEVIFHTGRDPRQDDPEVIKSVPLRIGIFRTWAEAARRYREVFEKNTGARPLWEQKLAWVRNIHAVHTGIPKEKKAEDYYRNLARIVEPEKLLLFYWNGNGIILFGDHQYTTKLGRPKPEVVDALKKYGFRWIGYHPYTLIYSPGNMPKRLKECKERWGLPEDYVFTPDYGGPPEKFYDYFRPISRDYFNGAKLWVYHPGSPAGRKYLVRNFGNYCKFHKMDGAYMDILGADHDSHFSPEKKVFDGMNWCMGEERVLRDIKEKHKELAIMSECQSPLTTAHTFYTWEGASHFTLPRAHPSIRTKVNHPLRTALWGSYTWTRDAGIEPRESALVGALPELILGNDWNEARCKLFAEEELFNDLPEIWEPEALAYYRGKGDKWFQFRNLPFGDGYVELTGDGYKFRLGRFRSENKSPLKEPARIQDWVGYEDNKPIGLNPERTYPFLIEPPKPEGKVWITGLPEGVFISAIRHSKKWSVIEFGTPEDKEVSGKISVFFHQKCLRVCDTKHDIEGPFESGTEKTFTTSIPGGLVFVWEEPAAVDTRFRSNLIGSTGRTLARGIPDLNWCYNSHTRSVSATVGEKTFPSISIGYGRYRGHAEAWVKLVKEGNPTLKFDIGSPPPPKKSRQVRPPLFYSVRVNSLEIWSEEIKQDPEWQPREIPLKPYIGRKILITISAQVTGDDDIGTSHLHQPALFGRVRIDNNPLSLEILDGSILPKPEEIIFTDSFKGEKLGEGWSVHISSAHGKKGSITVADGMICFTGQHYKYMYISQPLSEDYENISVQTRIQLHRTGCNVEWNPGLCLYWGKGKYCFITGGGYKGGDEIFAIRGCGARRIPLEKRKMMVRDDNYYDFWVKITLSDDEIIYYSSLDGKDWVIEAEIPRPKEYVGAPKLLILGRGIDGVDAKWNTGIRKTYIGELIIGRE